MTQPTPQAAKKLPLICKILYISAGASAVLYLLFMRLPAFSDWFNRTVAATGRRLLAYLTAWLPFSVAELLLCLLPIIVVTLIVIGCKHYCNTGRDTAVYVGMLLSAVCAIVILFVWCFAPGYYGSTLDKKLSLERKPSTSAELYVTADWLRAEMEPLIPEITFLPDGSSVMPYSYAEMNKKLLSAYDSFCERYDITDNFYSRVKPVMLSEPWSYTHITGVYTFFTGEANINVNFPDYTVPYTAAHELAHQRGIAREDEANFIAFLVCMESDDPYIRYSACLNVYEYVSSALRSADRELYLQALTSLPTEIQAEEVAYSRFFDKYRDNVAATVTEATNNTYLQSQGAAEGTRSYNMVVDLAVAYYKAENGQ